MVWSVVDFLPCTRASNAIFYTHGDKGPSVLRVRGIDDRLFEGISYTSKGAEGMKALLSTHPAYLFLAILFFTNIPRIQMRVHDSW